jgi:hypothetical protein
MGSCTPSPYETLWKALRGPLTLRWSGPDVARRESFGSHPIACLRK